MYLFIRIYIVRQVIILDPSTVDGMRSIHYEYTGEESETMLGHSGHPINKYISCIYEYDTLL